MRRYYEILGVPPHATQAEIKDAWLFSIKAFHPDKFSKSSLQQQAVANERTKAINEAYYVLSDRIRRADYDGERGRYAKAEPPPRQATPPPKPPPPRPEPPPPRRKPEPADSNGCGAKPTPRRKRPILYLTVAAIVVLVPLAAALYLRYNTPSPQPSGSAVLPTNLPKPASTPAIRPQAALATRRDQGRKLEPAEALKRAGEIDRLTQGIIQDSLIKPTRLTREEKTLLDKGQFFEMAGGQTVHSGHMILHLEVGDNKKEMPSVCFLFGMEDIEPARKEGESMAQFRYPRGQAEQFLFAEGWDKYRDRFFTRCYVQEGLVAYDRALAPHENRP